MTDSYSRIERDSACFAIEDAERDLMCLAMKSLSALEVATKVVGITPVLLRDARHRAVLHLLIHLRDEGRFNGDFASIALAVAQLRSGELRDATLADAADLDREFLYGLWTYQVPERHSLSTICQFLLTVNHEQCRGDLGWIAALSHGSDPTQVLAHLRVVLDPTSTAGPDSASAVLSIPTSKEQ